MCLEYIGSVALPEDLASLLDDILWQIPPRTIPVHTHLHILVSSACGILGGLTAWIKRMVRPHNDQPSSPYCPWSDSLVHQSISYSCRWEHTNSRKCAIKCYGA